MKTYAQYFTDFVLVDTAYKRNRFNLPLVNVVGVDNFGRTIMLAFGMLNNETISSYNWFFKMLKLCWGKNPDVFISDEDESIHKGSIFFCVVFNLTLGIKEILLQGSISLCGWHVQKKFNVTF